MTFELIYRYDILIYVSFNNYDPVCSISTLIVDVSVPFLFLISSCVLFLYALQKYSKNKRSTILGANGVIKPLFIIIWL